MEMVSKKKARNKDGCSRGLEAELMQEQKLPQEIILDEIMCRLPIKPLLRFRSVCKIFNSVISRDPKFAILQLKNSLANRTCFDRQRVMLWDPRDYSVAFLERNSKAEFSIKRINTCPIEGNESYEFVASCDGLVCIVSKTTNSIIFWNPLTGETKIASDPPEGISLSYDWCSHGLGYDSSSDDYKLIWIKNDLLAIRKPQGKGVSLSPQPNESAVFSLRKNSWRRIPDFPSTVMCFHKPSVFINGAFYWIGYNNTGGHYKVVSFCLEKEKYSLFDVPLFHSQSELFYTGIKVMGNKFATHCKSAAGGSFHLLFLDRDNCESWTNHTVTLPEGRHRFFTPLCLLEDVDEVLFRTPGREGELGIYNLSDDTFRYLHIPGLPKSFEVITFSESLISPNTYLGAMIYTISGMTKKEEESVMGHFT